MEESDVFELTYNELRSEIKRRNGSSVGKKVDLQNVLIQMLKESDSNSAVPELNESIVLLTPKKKSASRRKTTSKATKVEPASNDEVIENVKPSRARKGRATMEFEAIEANIDSQTQGSRSSRGRKTKTVLQSLEENAEQEEIEMDGEAHTKAKNLEIVETSPQNDKSITVLEPESEIKIVETQVKNTSKGRGSRSRKTKTPAPEMDLDIEFPREEKKELQDISSFEEMPPRVRKSRENKDSHKVQTHENSSSSETRKSARNPRISEADINCKDNSVVEIIDKYTKVNRTVSDSTSSRKTGYMSDDEPMETETASVPQRQNIDGFMSDDDVADQEVAAVQNRDFVVIQLEAEPPISSRRSSRTRGQQVQTPSSSNAAVKVVATKVDNDAEKSKSDRKSVKSKISKSKIPVGLPPTIPTPSSTGRARTSQSGVKLDRFKAAHEANYAKMESIEELHARVKARHQELQSGAGSVFSRLATPKRLAQRTKAAEAKNNAIGFDMGSAPAVIDIKIVENVDVVRDGTFMSQKTEESSDSGSRSRAYLSAKQLLNNRNKGNRLEQVRPHVGTSVFDRLAPKKPETTRRDEILNRKREEQEKESAMVERARTPPAQLTLPCGGIVDRLATPKSAIKPEEATRAARREGGYKPHKGVANFLDTLHLNDDDFLLLKEKNILKRHQGKMQFDVSAYDKVLAATESKMERDRLLLIRKKL